MIPQICRRDVTDDEGAVVRGPLDAIVAVNPSIPASHVWPGRARFDECRGLAAWTHRTHQFDDPLGLRVISAGVLSAFRRDPREDRHHNDQSRNTECDQIRSVQTAHLKRAGHSILSLAFASARVCHCMFSGESAPPRLSGTMSGLAGGFPTIFQFQGGEFGNPGARGHGL